MLKSLIILSCICLLLQLLGGFYRLSSAANISPDMESLIWVVETEEIKNMSDDAALMEEQALPANAGVVLPPIDKPVFFIRCSFDLPWHHTEAPVLPPELSSLL